MSVKRGVIGAVVAAALIVGGLTPAHATIVLGPVGDGHDIFVPGNNYRYGPALIRNDDHSIDMWTCSPGANGQWDYIRHSKSTNDGGTFGGEQVVLQSTTTTGSPDFASVCDPGVVKFGGYYYLAYTGIGLPPDPAHVLVDNPNHVFVARSEDADGPFEKWNGSGWGGTPQPFITYAGDDDKYGIGEPSLVVKDETLFIYYSEYSATSNRTLVATASTTSGDWPGSVTLQGTAIDRSSSGVDIGGPIQDTTDHKYVPSLDKFIAVDVAKRLSADSYIQVYESTDGLTYTPRSQITQGLQPYAHNMGITGDELGHFDPTEHNYIAYAYGPTWASWSTFMQPFNLNDVSSVSSVEKDNSSGTFTNYSDISAAIWRVQPFTVAGTTLPELKVWSYKQGTPAGPLEIRVYALDGSNRPTGLALSTSVLTPSEVSTTPGWITVEPGLTNLTPGGKYGIVLASQKSAAGGGSNAYGWGYSDANLYPSHAQSYTTNGGASWTTEANRSLKFITYTASVVDRDGSAGSFTDWASIGASQQRMQTFTTSSTTLTGIDVWTKRPASNAGDFVVSVYAADSSDNPTGSALWTSNLYPYLVSASYGWLRVYPNLTGLTPGGKYALVLSSPTGSGHYGWAFNDSNPFATGMQKYSVDGGATWVAETSRDLKIITYK
ncbi:hypothetical protein BH10ACT7_BH10ACT7_29710 [soil metagenome]